MDDYRALQSVNLPFPGTQETQARSEPVRFFVVGPDSIDL